MKMSERLGFEDPREWCATEYIQSLYKKSIYLYHEIFLNKLMLLKFLAKKFKINFSYYPS